MGQESSVKILRQFVATGTGHRQSYLFAGPFGSGKTTLGRILARALLCESPAETGDPCDSCDSCRSVLDGGTHTDFIEVDAATNSGKAEIKKITEEIAFATFSGRRRIYLFDESHQLSRDALDALLKPLEENAPGSEDKKLVCIFCTTEPEKMRATILSRCAPAFVIRPLSPEAIGKRLAYICEAEGIEYEPEMLPLIAELTECHIRDALKAVEGVSMLGPLNRANVTAYLHLDLNDAYLDVLLNIRGSVGEAIKAVDRILERTSPLTCYAKLAQTAMMAYRVGLGIEKPAGYWDQDRLAELSGRDPSELLSYSATFSSRPGRPSASMLYCDLAQLHHGGVLAPVIVERVVERVVEAPTPSPTPQPRKGTTQTPAPVGTLERPAVEPTSVALDMRAVKRDTGAVAPTKAQALHLPVDRFIWLLGLRFAELDEAEHGGSKGRGYLGRY